MFMSRYIAPATISSERDLVEYYIDTAEPVDLSSPKGYSERCIHSEVMKKFPEVNAVIHSHSEAVVPYTISGVPMKPCFHMAGFLGTHIPVYDIAKYYQDDDAQDMLVRNTRLGGALASHFSSDSASEAKGSPDYPVVLMRGHGLTVAGTSIQDVVLRGVYTQQNAAIQTTALTTRAAHFGPPGVNAQGTLPEIRYLNDQECTDALQMTKWSAYRPWGLWLREVEAMGLYVNMA
jgi:ribulose-5-phosphate 4-epimerase/fuculose-1-phosphate aldolase